MSDDVTAAVRFTDRLAAALGYREEERFARYAEEVIRLCEGFAAEEIERAADKLIKRAMGYPRPGEITAALEAERPARPVQWAVYDRTEDGVAVYVSPRPWMRDEAERRMWQDLDRAYGAGQWRIEVAAA